MLPTPAEYQLAFELPEDNFNTRQITPVYENGKVWMSSHESACVFKGQENGKPVAIKCFTKPIAGRRERYRLIADYLASRSESCWVGVEYLSEEFYVDSSAGSKSYDVVLMPWIEGQTLGEYVARACQRQDRAALQKVARNFGQLAAWLLQQEFAHGDLTHDNLIVGPGGGLVLIDYDGMYVPALHGYSAIEIGKQGYQHPARAAHHFDRHSDDFSILIITLSLHALAAGPGLYQEKNTDNLLLSQADLQNLQGSPMLNRLFALNHPEVNRLLILLFQSLAAQSLHMPQLPALLPQEPPVPVLIHYRKGDKVGFCTPDKRIVVACEYDEAWPFTEGVAVVKKNNKYGFVDNQGHLFVLCENDKAEWFSEGLAAVQKNGKWGFVSKSGQLVVSCEYDNALNFSDGVAMVEKNGKWGFVNKSGQLVIPCEYDKAWNFSDGFTIVKKNNKYGFVNIQSQLVVSCEYDEIDWFNEGLVKLQKNGKWGFVSKSGQLVLPCEYDEARNFSEGLAVVKKNNKCGFVNTQGQLVIPCEYDDACDFSEGLAWVEKNGKDFCVNRDGVAYYEEP